MKKSFLVFMFWMVLFFGNLQSVQSMSTYSALSLKKACNSKKLPVFMVCASHVSGVVSGYNWGTFAGDAGKESSFKLCLPLWQSYQILF